MTRIRTHVPAASRWLVVAAVLVAVLPAGGAGASPSKHDVQQATAKVQRLLGDIKDARGQLANLQRDLAAKTALVNARRADNPPSGMRHDEMLKG